MVYLAYDVKTLWLNISESIQKHGVLEGVHDDCKVCKIEPKRCENSRTVSKSL